MEIIAEGLAFPEGPVVTADGSVIVVEIMAGRVTRCWKGRTEVICETGGGPNGAAIGPDGALWICNNGGMAPGGERGPGRIERIDLSTGRCERVHESCDGIALRGPNDLVFDSTGRLWFTDLGSGHEDVRMIGGLFTVSPDGGTVTAVNRRSISYNGIGLSPDQRSVYVADTYQARVYRYDNRAEAQQPEWIATGIGPVGFDSLAVTEAGNVCVAMVMGGGGVATVTPQGTVTQLAIPDDPYVTNIAFGGTDMRDAYITLSGTGRLARMRWDEPGLKLAFGG